MKFWQWFANNIAPKELLYFAVIKVWAKATCEKYTNKTPDEVNWEMALNHLDVDL